MGRNRKCQSAAIRFGPALKAFLLCLLIGGSAVGYVWQKNQIYQLGQQLRLREIRLGQLIRQNKNHEQQLNDMRTAPKLEQRIKELNLELMAPLPSQVWRLTEPSRESQPAVTAGQVAAHVSRSAGTQ
jgi:hypothetical protein